MKPILKLYKLGRLSYQRALTAQHLLFNNLKLKKAQKTHMVGWSGPISTYNASNSTTSIDPPTLENDITNSLILVEHEPVYTIGIRSQQYNHDYVTKLKQKLAEHKLEADFYKTERGGLVTFHGPGQLVAYPIIYLGDFRESINQKSLKAYVHLLENTIIDTLDRVGIKRAHTVTEYPGVWLNNGERKIAFIGITCKRYVTMHGISINCNCDLTWFDHIVSCGIEDKAITSIRQELSNNIPSPNLASEDKRQATQVSPNQQGTNIFQNGDNNSDLEPPILQNVATQFCSSFSDHFKCDFVTAEFPWHYLKLDGYKRFGEDNIESKKC